jgi:cell division protein FtsW
MKVLKELFHGDSIVWIVYMLFITISLVEVFSASSTLAYKSGDHHAAIAGHAVNLGIGLLTVWTVHHIPWRWFRLAPHILLPLSCILLVTVSFMGLLGDVRVNGASRWLWGFQPSEMAKLALISTVAYLTAKHQKAEGCAPEAFRPLVLCIVSIFALIAPENGSTALLLFGVSFLMMIIGRVPAIQLCKFGGASLAVAAAFVGIIMVTPASKYRDLPMMHRVETWQSRIREFVQPKANIPAAKYDIDGKAQRAHSSIAISKSHILGAGPGNSTQREFLPQAYSDFIFAIIIEELGLLGGFGVVFLYVILLIRVWRIAKRCSHYFPSLLIMGLSLMIFSQAMINLAVAVDMLPITGQPLPLISRGGSNIFINSIFFGIILSVSRSVYDESDDDGTSQFHESDTQSVTLLLTEK